MFVRALVTVTFSALLTDCIHISVQKLAVIPCSSSPTLAWPGLVLIQRSVEEGVSKTSRSVSKVFSIIRFSLQHQNCLRVKITAKKCLKASPAQSLRLSFSPSTSLLFIVFKTFRFL